MKKITLPILFLFATLGFSQKVSLGPEIGLNIIPIEKTDIGYNHQLGYHVGGHLKYHFSKRFKLSSGIFLTQKKKGYSSSTTGSTITLIEDVLSGFGGGLGGGLGTGLLDGLDSTLNNSGLNTDYTESTKGVSSELFIEIPLLANYKYKNVNFYLGPYTALLLSAKRKEELTTDIPLFDLVDVASIVDSLGLGGFGGLATSFLPESGTETSEKTGTNGLRALDFGINVGVGYEVNNLHFNLMYSYGLLDYRDDKKDEPTEKLNTLRFTIFYLFNLKRKKDFGQH